MKNRAGAHNTKTKVVVRVARRVVVTVSNTAVRSVVVPAAAAFDAVRPRRGANLYTTIPPLQHTVAIYDFFEPLTRQFCSFALWQNCFLGCLSSLLDFFVLSRTGAHNTKTKAAVRVARRVAVTASNTAARSVAAPAAAA